MLNQKEMLIVEEYLVNGFNKTQSYKVGYPNQSYSSLRVESCKFFKREDVKEYVEEKIREQVEGVKTLTNKMLINLEYDVFEREVDENFTWKEKQNSQKMMIGLLKQLDINENPREEEIVIFLDGEEL